MSYFDQVLEGKTTLTTSADVQLFSKAIVDVRPKFIEGPINDVLRYLRVPQIKEHCNGYFLRRIIRRLVDPPVLWNAIVAEHRRGELVESVEESFAWLLLELIRDSSVDHLGFRAVAQEIAANRSFVESSHPEVQLRGGKVENTLAILEDSRDKSRAIQKSGHKEELIDFRPLQIYPTAEEKSAFSLTAFHDRLLAICAPDDTNKISRYLDVNFRLLRADLHSKISDDLEKAMDSFRGDDAEA